MAKSIFIHERKTDDLVGWIATENGSLKYVIYRKDALLEDYLNSHKAEWEAKTFVVRGSKLKDGIQFHTGTKAKLGDEKYLVGLYFELFDHARKDVFDMKYYFIVL